MSVTNPNEPRYPYGGGTDNPGDNTAVAGGPAWPSGLETGAPPTAVIHGTIPTTIAQSQSDYALPGGVQAVPPTSAGFGFPTDGRGRDTGGVTVDPVTGYVRVSGQDETQGEMETTPGVSPSAFPEPNP
jgi:hypothetical protein